VSSERVSRVQNDDFAIARNAHQHFFGRKRRAVVVTTSFEAQCAKHYVELHLRTYRLFVLQPELNLIQYCRRRETGRRNYAFECECESAKKKMRS
jgi:hypothetical protein